MSTPKVSSILPTIAGGVANLRGSRVVLTAANIDFTTIQNVFINLPSANQRFIVQSAKVLSNLIASLSGGATAVLSVVNQKVFTAATLTTSTGTNASFLFTARVAGTGGNSINIVFVNPGTTTASESVAVASNTITVTLRYASGAITSTGAQVLAALQASAPAMALVSVSSTGTGAGTVTALTSTPLAGGLNWTAIGTVAPSAALSSSDSANKIQALTTTAAPAFEGGYAMLLQITSGSTATTDNKDLVIDMLAI